MGRLIVITTPDLAPGFRLAGATTLLAESPETVAGLLTRLVDVEREDGVIGVHEPFLAGIDGHLRRRLDDLVAPVVVAIPAGDQDRSGWRRGRLADMLQRAVGREITFRPGGNRE